MSNYSIPRETEIVFQKEILDNPLLSHLPAELKELSKKVHFEGNDKPSVPINWRFAESVASLKALEATFVNYLLTRKYKVLPVDVTINTDHASLFYMSPLIVQIIDETGKPKPLNPLDSSIQKLFPSQDIHNSLGSLHRSTATSIYKTNDGRFYHVHGSMNAVPTLTALGLPPDGEPDDTYGKAFDRIQKKVFEHDAAELDELMNEKYRQAGTIAYTVDEYFSTESGKANGSVGLYELSQVPGSTQPPSWWPENRGLPSSPKRPLAGLKVVDLTRVIAGPAITRGLAELGASVMRVVSPHISDLTPVLHDLSWGKWNAFLHLKDEADKEKLRQLILEADIIVDGYRPGVMERLGFGRQTVFDLVRNRDRGIIYVRENCYGWHGPWSHRTGWQQISDACCGISLGFGKAMGLDEAVTPIFPNSDFCTGIAGTSGVLDALIQRAEKGGSYTVDTSLNYYSQWLARSVGTYNEDVWHEVWKRHGSPVFHHWENMQLMLPKLFKLLYMHDKDVLFNPAFFESRRANAIGATLIMPKPVAQYKDKAVEPGYKIGVRGNGVDKPMWPEDLSVEIVQ